MRQSLLHVFFLSLLAGAASAQSDRGTITGTVTDSTGAVIPRVTVTFRQTGSGALATTVTNESGQYSRPNLSIGAYQVTFDSTGFKRYVRSGVTLGISDVQRLDVTLEIGSTSDSVEVTAELSKLQTDTPQIGTTLDNKSLTNLPLSFSGGRQAENFAYMITPGVTGSTFNSHINGSGSFAKETLVDGASTTVNQGGDFSPMAVSIEALQEVKFQTGGLSAEFGRTQTGVFNYVMKSGQNQVHGSAYGGLRNEALNANTFSNKARGVERAPDRKQNYAFSFGGPIFIPKIYNGHNRTFFYASFEGYKERNYGLSAPNKTSPIADFYQGDFSRLLGPTLPQTDALGGSVARGAIYDPASFSQLASGRWIGSMFPGNRIPVSRFSQVARNLNAIATKSYLPTITGSDGLVRLQNNQVFPVSGNPELDHKQYSIKFDHMLSTVHKITGSYNYKSAPRFILDAAGMWDPNNIYGGPLAKTRRRPDDGGFSRLSHDWTISPRILNTFTLNYNRRGNPERILEADTDGAKILGIKNLSTLGYPAINWGGGPFVSLEQPGFQNVSFRADQTTGFVDTFSFSRGRHFLKAGFDLRLNQQNRIQTPSASFTFSARATSIPNEVFSSTQTGYSFASYLLGIVDSAGLSDPVTLGGRRHYYGAFIQDDFKVTRNLTINLGLRWEFQPPVFEVADRLSSWNPTKIDPKSGLPGAYDFAGSCTACTGQSYFGKRDWKDFGPRFGFSWRALPKVVVRGAYGIMYEGDPPDGYNAVPLGKPNSVAWGGTYALSSDPVRPWAGIFNWDNGFPTNRFQPAAFDVSWGNLNRPGMFDANYGLSPYIQNWNFNIQTELPSHFRLDLGYVGNKATRLRIGELQRINQLPASVLQQYGTRLNNSINSEADAIRNGVKYPYSGFQGTVASSLRQYPQVQGNQTINVYGSPLGFSTYHGMQVVLNREFSKGLTVYTNYTWSKNLTNTESSLIGDNGSRPLDYYNLKLEKAVADYDSTHVFKAFASYDLPVGRGKAIATNSGRIMNTLAGGWNVAAILNYASGTPLSFPGSAALSGGWNGATNRANVAAGDLRAAGYDKSKFDFANNLSPVNTYINKALFSDPPALTLGTGARTYSQIRGFGTSTENLTLTKSQALTERVRFQIRTELLNALNRHQLGGINTSVTNANFGQVTSVSGNRQIQLSVRFDF